MEIAARSRDPSVDLPGPFPAEDLLEQVGRKRDRAAFVSLFEHFAPRIKGFLIKSGLSPEQADELAQETMLSVWQNAASYDRTRSSATTWIFTIARNRRIDLLRRARPVEVSEAVLDQLPAPDGGYGGAADAAIDRADRVHKIAKILETLPPEQSDLILKSYYEEKPHQAIAQETGLPLGTIKSRIRLALERMRKELEDKAAWL